MVSIAKGYFLTSSTAGGEEKEEGESPYPGSKDPMIQQIQKIKRYLAEAKMHGKLDEVETFQENLRHLQVREHCFNKFRRTSESFDYEIHLGFGIYSYQL